ncbi:hypothetical protein [Nostoc punctiforme]|uniref:PEP-CTERM protein-sorting domain-containing protein n=1 Tax=Nostoc punctiforme (strain ATCC 29133 / PCC 73102) TaxID=63737 RepID=B2IYV9_NOSP7|nr:hypothetical protein [Nostoc punctiforme]ACC81692.1 hypothetical protein Npun_R3249 [Nostoc punctiforme PCC 73102]
MALRSHSLNICLVPLVFSLVSVGASTAKAIAQTIYPFDVVYDTEVTLTPIPSTDVSTAFVSGFNSDAPYGLNNFLSINNYSRTDPNTGNLLFFQDAAKFGLQGLPIGRDEFFGSGEDKLFGSSSATASFDFINRQLVGFGTITITGGTGRFIGATGIFNFSEIESLDQDPTALLKGQAFLNGSFQTPQKTPEPRTNATLLGICVIGIGLMLRRRYFLGTR